MKRDIEALIAELTLEEKAGLCSGLDFWRLKGVERLGIPSIMVTDGPHGLRKQQGSSDHLGLFESVPATCFPSAVGLASSWNTELIQQVGVALGEECQAEDVAVLLGPGANIKRSPLCGRNFEYFSEDPYLSSQMAAHHIKGVQSQGVGTSLKHFAVNNQEHRRMSVNAEVDMRTLREIYLASFEGAVKQAQPWTVMSSYNKINGEYASENEWLLTTILRDEWGLEGFVVTDWGGTNQRVDSIAAGNDLEMPGSGGFNDQKIVNAVNNGTLSEEKLDRAVRRILTIIFRSVDNKKPNATYNHEEHHQLARKVAAESMVLLKNDQDILPLSQHTAAKIAVIGAFAQKPRFQGGGSSHINPSKLDNPLEEIKRMAGEQVTISFAQGYDINQDQADEHLVREAIMTAQAADKVILFVGLPDRYESEGYDRTHLRMPANQEQLINEISKVNQQVVVVLMNGSPIEMPWLDHVNAVLEAYLGGQATGGAIADLLFGIQNPSGKLAETFPLQVSDNPSFINFPGEQDLVQYREGIFVGYRHYDTKQIRTLFPFGHGLSYTTFEYSNLNINQSQINDTDQVEVQVTITNTGSKTGKEAVQLYVQDKTGKVIRPSKELKAFAKVELAPAESKVVSFTLDKRSFAYYNVQINDWHVHSGEYSILVGRSSAHIELTESLQIQSTVTLPLTVHRNSLIGDLLQDERTNSIAMQLMQQFASGLGMSADQATEHEGMGDMFKAMMQFMPLRNLVSFNQGKFSDEMLEHLINTMNEGIKQEAVSAQ